MDREEERLEGQQDVGIRTEASPAPFDLAECGDDPGLGPRSQLIDARHQLVPDPLVQNVCILVAQHHDEVPKHRHDVVDDGLEGVLLRAPLLASDAILRGALRLSVPLVVRGGFLPVFRGHSLAHFPALAREPLGGFQSLTGVGEGSDDAVDELLARTRFDAARVARRRPTNPDSGMPTGGVIAAREVPAVSATRAPVSP